MKREGARKTDRVRAEATQSERGKRAMRKMRRVLGSTALGGVLALAWGVGPAWSQIEVSVGGFARWAVAFGDLGDVVGATNRRSLYFRNDTEVFVTFRGKDDATGTEYGAKIELEADTNALANADETWLWIKGSWGELRLGDEDGAADANKVGGFSVAAGTGGIDGMAEVAPVPIFVTNSGDATKIRYDSPSFGGLRVSVSYTPDSGQGGNATFPFSNVPGNLEHWIEGALVFSGGLGPVDVRASVIGSMARFEVDPLGNGNDFRAIGGGLRVGYGAVSAAAGYFVEKNDQGGDRKVFNAGLAYSFGIADVSLTMALADPDGPSNPRSVVLSGTLGLFPGVALQGDVAVFERDVGLGGLDSGVTGVVRLHIAG